MKTKDSQVFCEWTNKIQVFNSATIENFKTVLTYLTSQETALKFLNVINHLFSENIVIGQSSFNCPGLSVRTVINLIIGTDYTSPSLTASGLRPLETT